MKGVINDLTYQAPNHKAQASRDRADGTVSFYARNPTGNPAGTVDLASGTVRIRVRKQ